jgi:hypothetical protein
MDGVHREREAERSGSAAMELQQIYAIGLETLETAIDLFRHLFPIPVIAIHVMTALREEKILIPAFKRNFTDFLFAVNVALGRIDHVQTSVRRAVDQLVDCFLGHAPIADLGRTVAEHGYIHPGLAENAFFHWSN